ncbi:MAG: ferredoxin domain-containing protein, partial [Syntrophobacteraceae bacterium]|nr:ferredoxin domain-containing protein [Syntrophobacteraceae bacterium]
FPTCAEFQKERKPTDKEMGYTGPHCVMRMMDIGVALASAAKTAGLLNIDNRVQQRVGAGARALGLIDAEVVMGVPCFARRAFRSPTSLTASRWRRRPWRLLNAPG